MMMTTMRRFHAATLILSLAPVAACFDSPSEPPPPGASHVVVLHAVGSLKGVTVNDTAAAGPRISLPAEFDGGAMFLGTDTVVTASSSWGTNKLHLVAFREGVARDAEMPAGSDAAGAALAHGFRGAHAAVALRTTRRVALVTFPASGGGVVAPLEAVGRCPYDVAVHDASLWVVDYNSACDVDYAWIGDSRLIRIPASGSARDTILLPGIRNATAILVDGDLAYVSAIGEADYSAFPAVTFVAPGSITVVNLRTRQVIGTVRLPQGTNGATAALGGDGNVYVSAYVNTGFEQGAFAIDPGTMGFTGPRNAGAQSLRLTRADGSAAQCAAVTADARGRIYCAVNQGASQSTSLFVFDGSTGAEVRSFATGGTGAVAIGVR